MQSGLLAKPGLEPRSAESCLVHHILQLFQLHKQVVFITTVLDAFPSNLERQAGIAVNDLQMRKLRLCPSHIAKKWQSPFRTSEEILSGRGVIRTRTQSCLALSPDLFLQNNPYPFLPLQFPRSSLSFPKTFNSVSFLVGMVVPSMGDSY